MVKSMVVWRVCAGMFVVLAGSGLPGLAAAADQPNIILLISDDHRWDALGIAGNSNIKTPNLDKMAREGQWYREATIHIPLCAPSRAVMLTGLPPGGNGYYRNTAQRKSVQRPQGFEQFKLLPQQMVKAGYHTAFVGKWHLLPDPWLCGFETVKHWMLPGMGPYKEPRLATGNSRDLQKVPGFTQTIFANDALDEMKAKADGKTTKPLFLWVAFTAPHARFIPNPEPYSGMYDGKTAEELAPSTYRYDPAKVRGGDESWQHYYEAISALDGQVGRIMDTVRNSALSTNTVVIFIGDNGFMMGSRGLWGKGVPYEDSVRVPLIVWGPDSVMKAKGTTVTASANSIDLPPSIVRLAGATPPSEWVGRDLGDTIRDGKPHGVTWAVSEFPALEGQAANGYRTIRTPDFKLIVWEPESGKQPELYNLTKDPGEKVNIYGQPEIADTQVRLEKQLTEFRMRAGGAGWELKDDAAKVRGFGADNNSPRADGEGKTKSKKGKRGKAGRRNEGGKRQRPARN